MGLKFKDLSKSNKITYTIFWFVSAICLIDIFIQFNIWIFFLGIMFALKTLDVKSEQKSMNLLDDYAEICTKQSDAITDLCFKLDEAEEKIKKLESKKTTKKTVEKKVEKNVEKKSVEKKTKAKKTTTKKSTTKKPIKKETKKDGSK